MSENNNSKNIKINKSEHPAFAKTKDALEKINKQPLVQGAKEQYAQFSENESVQQAKEKANQTFGQTKNIFNKMVLGKDTSDVQNFDPNQGQFQGQNFNPSQGQFQGQNFDPNQGQFQGQQNFDPNQGQFQGQQNFNPNQGQFQGQQNFNPNQGQFQGQNFNPSQGQIPFPQGPQNPILKFLSVPKNLIITFAGIALIVVMFLFLTKPSINHNTPEQAVESTLNIILDGDLKELPEAFHFENPEEQLKFTEKYQEALPALNLIQAGAKVADLKYQVIETDVVSDSEARVKVSMTSNINPDASTERFNLVKVDGKWKFKADEISDIVNQ